MAGQLVERRDGTVRGSHALKNGVTTIGRAADSDIVVSSPFISSRHAEVQQEEDHYILFDRSRNGTFVNGERLTEPHRLHTGDVIVLPGDSTISFEFENRFTTVPWTMSGSASAPDPLLATAVIATGRKATGVWVDARTAEVWVDGAQVHLRPKEYLALSLLFARTGALVPRQELVAQVWPDYPHDISADDVAQLIRGLREKIEPDPSEPRYLLTVRGLGYRLMPG